MLDGLFVVLDERLVEQGNFFEVFLHTTLDPLFHNLFRLHRLTGRRCHRGIFSRLGRSHRALTFDQFSWHLIGRQGNRLHGSHVHGYILSGRAVTCIRHQHANTGAVQIRSHVRAGSRAIEAPESHVFADLSNQAFTDVFQSRTEPVLGVRQGREGRNISWIVLRHQRRSRISQSQEAVIFGHEVGFAIDFQHRAGIRAGTQHDDAFRGDPGSSFTGFTAQFDPQNFFCTDHIALGLGQRLFALHHGSIRLAAQFSDHGSGNRSHISLSVLKLCSKN